MIKFLLTFTVSVILGGVGLTLARQPHDHGPAGPVVKVLSAVDVVEKLDGKSARVTTLEVTFAPKASGTPHRHPGPVFGTVLEGELVSKVGDTPTRTYKTGETFYEPTLALHAVSRNPSDTTPTRVLAVLLHPRDAKELVIPEPTPDKK